MRRALLGAIGCLFLLPAAAEAATVRVAGGSINYSAAAGETDAVSIAVDGRRVEFRSTAAQLEAGKGCRGGGDVVLCRVRIPEHVDIPSPGSISLIPGLVMIQVGLGDGDDTMDATALPSGLRVDGERQEITVFANDGEGDDLLLGGEGNDQIYGASGDDAIFGRGGTDVLDSRSRSDGADTFDGGAGRDLVDFDSRESGVSVTLDGEANDGATGEGDSILSVEFMLGSDGDDVLEGGDGRTFIFGAGGDDRITGAGGDDFLAGDFLTLGAGDDRIDGGEGGDFVEGGLGRDVMLGGSGEDNVDARRAESNGKRDERDRVDCGADEDDARAQGKDRLRACEHVRRVD